MREWNDIAVLAPARDIDLASVPGLRDEMDALVAAGGRRILVNCENVAFIDSTGLAFLLSRARRLMQEGGMLSLVNVSPEVARFLQIAQLLSVLHVTGREKPPVPVLSAGTPPLWSRSISVAEGVETKEDEALIRELGCDAGQGYYYSRPVPVADFEKWLESV